MGSLLIKNIHSLVTCNGEDRILRGADLGGMGAGR